MFASSHVFFPHRVHAYKSMCCETTEGKERRAITVARWNLVKSGSFEINTEYWLIRRKKNYRLLKLWIKARCLKFLYGATESFGEEESQRGPKQCGLFSHETSLPVLFCVQGPV